MSKAAKSPRAVEGVPDPGEHHPNGNIHTPEPFTLAIIFVCVFICMGIIYPDLTYSDITLLSSVSQNC